MMYKALANLASNQTSNSVSVIEPAVLSTDEKVSKKLSGDVIRDYEVMITSCITLEDFSKALNAISGALGLNLNTDVVILAKIANKLREVKGLPPL